MDSVKLKFLHWLQVNNKHQNYVSHRRICGYFSPKEIVKIPSFWNHLGSIFFNYRMGNIFQTSHFWKILGTDHSVDHSFFNINLQQINCDLFSSAAVSEHCFICQKQSWNGPRCYQMCIGNCDKVVLFTSPDSIIICLHFLNVCLLTSMY